MENASKALIIAGAILLGILIVGLGMFIYQQAAGAARGFDLKPQEIQAYNAKFQAYEGRQNGSSVIQLCNEVRAHNSSNQEDNTLQISVTYGSVGTAKTNATLDTAVTFETITNVKNAIRSGKLYNVTFQTATSGRIMNITITDLDSKS